MSFLCTILASAMHEAPSPTLEHIASLHAAVLPEMAPEKGSPGTSPVGYFLRTLNSSAGMQSVVLEDSDAKSLDGLTHYRLLPGVFPKGMGYHFDGLATVLKMWVADGKLHFFSKPFHSGAFDHWDRCLFYGTGTGPTLGTDICFQSPGVNLLPIQGQLWLTIDTSSWGRVDPVSLATIDGASVDVGGAFTLNAHPACDPESKQCFVQHPCPQSRTPLSDEVCVSELLPSTDSAAGMGTAQRTRIKLPYNKLIQHSHSPCITPHYVISKLDAFHGRDPLNSNSGLLK